MPSTGGTNHASMGVESHVECIRASRRVPSMEIRRVRSSLEKESAEKRKPDGWKGVEKG